jgi:hypothetical protein
MQDGGFLMKGCEEETGLRYRVSDPESRQFITSWPRPAVQTGLSLGWMPGPDRR